MRLSDGCVIPSYMGCKDTSHSAGIPGFFGEVTIMVGEVIQIFYPDDKENVTGDTEYVVSIWRRQSNGLMERITFRCSQSDSFGSVADWFRFSFRASESNPQKTTLGNGATVLVACINGDRSNAYIIGAIPQPNRPQVDPDRSEGRYLRGKFNGVTIAINDDGSFSLEVPGAEDNDGNPDNRDSNNHGSKVTFAKTGDITVDDNNGDSVIISPGSKSITVASGQTLTEKSDEINVNANSSWTLTAPVVNVVSENVNIGAKNLQPINNGIVLGQGIDTFSGATFFELGDTSLTVKAND